MSTPQTRAAHPALDVDLTDPRVHAEQDLRAFFGRLRRDHPVVWHPAPAAVPDAAPPAVAPGFWLVTRYADAQAICRDQRAFSSRSGNMLATLLSGGDPAGGRMLVVSDAPHHTRLRSLMRRAFSPAALERLRHQVRAATRRLLMEAVERGTCDGAQDIAAQIPLNVICDLLAVPESDRAFILRQTSAALSSHGPVPTTAEGRRAQLEILLYFSRLAKVRAEREPQDDMVSLLAHAQLAGERLADDELFLNCYSLILGGDETTRLSMIGAMHALAVHADQWAALSGGSVDVATAVEEVLRWTTAVMHMGRTATRDVELHGQLIRAGDPVVVWTQSANADEREFPEPYAFDLARSPNRHLSFGHGPHFCLGAQLARLEIGVLLEELRATARAIELVGEPQRVYSNFVTGMSSLPIRLPAREGLIHS
jgi:cytochrome P450